MPWEVLPTAQNNAAVGFDSACVDQELHNEVLFLGFIFKNFFLFKRNLIIVASFMTMV